MMKKMKRIMGTLLSFLTVLGLIKGMSLTALAWNGDPYASLVNTTTVIHFDSKEWYLVEDNSTAADAGTVTLLSKECVAASKYDSNGSSNTYSGSTLETAVNTYYKNNISSDAKTAVSGNEMFLLTSGQANTITNKSVRKSSQYSGTSFNAWWLCSPGRQDILAAFVMGNNGNVDLVGHVGYTLGVRPALKLNLESVIFSSNSKTFSVCQTISANDINVTCSDTDKSVSAKVTMPKNDGGVISYAVKSGSEDYISVNASTGVLTIRKVPTEGKAYVIVTAAAIGNYAQANKEVTVTITHGPQMLKTEEKEATEETEGNKAYWTCSGCGKYFSDEDGKEEVQEGWWVIDKLAHTHKLIKTEEKEPTEEAEGNKAYWTCSGCGKYFSDEDGKEEVQEGWWVIDKLAHSNKPVESDENVATGESEEKVTTQKPEEKVETQKAEEKVTTQKPEEKVETQKAEEKVATQKTEVKKSSETTKENTTTQKTKENATTQKTEVKATTEKSEEKAAKEKTGGNNEVQMVLGGIRKPSHTHKLKKTAAKGPKGKTNGNTEYWYCSSCKKYFADKNGKKEIKKNSWVILARNKTFTDSKSKGKYKVTSKGMKNPTVTYIGCTDSKATTVSIPSKVKYGAMTYKVTEIGKRALKGKKNLTKITVGKNVTSIGAQALSGCSALKSLTLSEKTTTLGKGFLNKCNKNIKITIKSTKLTKTTVKNGAFTGIPNKSSVKITVPKGMKNDYKTVFRKKGLGMKVTVKARSK